MESIHCAQLLPDEFGFDFRSLDMIAGGGVLGSGVVCLESFGSGYSVGVLG